MLALSFKIGFGIKSRLLTTDSSGLPFYLNANIAKTKKIASAFILSAQLNIKKALCFTIDLFRYSYSLGK